MTIHLPEEGVLLEELGFAQGSFLRPLPLWVLERTGEGDLFAMKLAA